MNVVREEDQVDKCVCALLVPFCVGDLGLALQIAGVHSEALGTEEETMDR